MAGMTPVASRRQGSVKKLVSGTAAVEPAIEASAERAAIEREAGADVDADAALAVPAADLPASDAAVLPEPTLVAEPGAPQPIVTAAPVLAAEPTATDVVKADAAADRAAAGLEPAADLSELHQAAAGQTTLAIDMGTGAVTGIDGHLGSISVGSVDRDANLIRELTEFRDRDPEGFARLEAELDGARIVTLDEIVRGLEHLALTDPIGMDIVRTRFFATDEIEHGDRLAAMPDTAGTITVIEVVGPPQSRRRIGRSFGATPTRFLAGELTEDEIATLRSDPLLAVGISQIAADTLAPPADV